MRHPDGNVICVNKKPYATLKATGCVGTVLWSDGQTGTSITSHQLGDDPQYSNYTAQCVTACGTSLQSNKVDFHIFGSPNPPSILSSGEVTACKGQGFSLKATGCPSNVDGKWLWNTGATASEIWVEGTNQEGLNRTYTVQCETACGMSVASAPVRVTMNTRISLSASKEYVERGESTTLSLRGCTGKIQWMNDNDPHTADLTIKPKATVNYFVSCFHADGCQEDKNINITVGACKKVTSIEKVINGVNATLSLSRLHR